MRFLAVRSCREELMTTKPVLVTDNSSLQELCAVWKTLDFLALDTEFIRVDTFFPKLGLVQVCDNTGSYLLDPLALTDWQAFVDILVNPDIHKVLHSCSEDLQVFQVYFSCVPEGLFDTQRAAAFLGYGFSLSYQNLVRELMQLEVPKGETRSDWLRRPLSEQQLEYAALDVAYLPDLYRSLKQQLENKGYLDLLYKECEQMRKIARLADDPAQWPYMYQGLGAAWRLDRQQLAVLKALCIWRERTARDRNKPRSWIAKDADLILLAETRPKRVEDLREIRDLSSSVRNHQCESIVREIAAVDILEEVDDVLAVNRPLTAGQRRRLKRCQSVVRQISEQTGIAVELLARKKQLIALLLQYDNTAEVEWPLELDGWRRDLLEDRLIDALAAESTEA